MRRFIPAIAFLLAPVLLFAGPSSYRSFGNPRTWFESRLTYSWTGQVPETLQPDQIQAIVSKSFDAWSKELPGSAFQFRFAPSKVAIPTTSEEIGKVKLASLTSDVDILIVFTRHYVNFVPSLADALAATVEPVQPEDRLGRKLIFVDSLKMSNRDPDRLSHVVRHEIGHALGLEHSPVNAFPYAPRLNILPPRVLPDLPAMSTTLFTPRATLHPDDQAWGQDLSNEGTSPLYGSISGVVVDADHPAEEIEGVQVIAVEVGKDLKLPSDLSSANQFACVTPYGPALKELKGDFRIVVPRNKWYRVIVRNIPIGFKIDRVTPNGNLVEGEHTDAIYVDGPKNLARAIRATIRVKQ